MRWKPGAGTVTRSYVIGFGMPARLIIPPGSADFCLYFSPTPTTLLAFV